MYPTLQRIQFSKFRYFNFFLILNYFGVIIVGFINSLWGKLNGMSDPTELCFKLN